MLETVEFGKLALLRRPNIKAEPQLGPTDVEFL
jgi:hypothetical protein